MVELTVLEAQPLHRRLLGVLLRLSLYRVGVKPSKYISMYGIARQVLSPETSTSTGVCAL